MSAHALTVGYAALWAATVAGALLALAGAAPFATRPPHDVLPPSPNTVLELVAHNAPVALWPLALVALGWPTLAGARMLGDLLTAAQLLAHGLLVGAQLGTYPATWRYLPHLPLEWLALAIPAAAWMHVRTALGQNPALGPALRARAHDDSVTGLVAASAAASFAALLAAAALETYLVPLELA